MTSIGEGACAATAGMTSITSISRAGALPRYASMTSRCAPTIDRMLRRYSSRTPSRSFIGDVPLVASRTATAGAWGFATMIAGGGGADDLIGGVPAGHTE